MSKKDYEPIALGDTAGLDNDEWLRWREHGPNYNNPLDPSYIPVTVGGSAVSVIFGDNPWKSKLEFYHEKSQTRKPKYARPMNQAVLDAGHELEDFVANMFITKMLEEGITDIQMWNDTIMYQHPLYPFAVCNLDRRLRVNGQEGILECKTTGNWDDVALWKQGIVPKKYEWQCRYYMATMNLDFCYICCCWGFTAESCAVILIVRDRQIEDVMMREVAAFVECCELGVEPEMQTKHMKTLATYYTRLYGEIPDSNVAMELPDSKDVYDLVEEASLIAGRKEKLTTQLTQLEEQEYAITCKIMELTDGKSTYVTYRKNDEEVYALKLKLPMKRAKFDEEQLKKDDPAMYEKYQTKFDATLFKAQQKALAKKYTLPTVVDVTKPVKLDSVVLKNIPVRSVS